jgi:protoporphyrinogen IX oxidase
VIFWIAGLFMLPRFYVYHQEAAPGSAEEARWVERERKLRTIILTPSMILVWLLGLALAYTSGAFTQGWLHAKLLLVFLLSGYHGYMIGYGRKLAGGQRPASGKALRIMNEVPGLATVLIVILVIVKPF